MKAIQMTYPTKHKQPTMNEKYSPKTGTEISPPVVTSPLYQCQKVVNVSGFMPHALVTVYANNSTGIQSIGQGTPYLGYGDITLTRTLTTADSVTATQTIGTLESMQSYTPVQVLAVPTPLQKPSVGSDIYECGQVVPVNSLVAGRHVEVFDSPHQPATQSAANMIGQADTSTATAYVVTSALKVNDLITAEQIACPQSAHTTSPASNAVKVKPVPHPMHAPAIGNLIAGNDVIEVKNLYVAQ